MPDSPHNEFKSAERNIASPGHADVSAPQLPEQDKKVYAKLLESSQEITAVQWAEKNIAAPFLNSLVIDSHNAISSSVNDVSKLAGGSALLNDWRAYETAPAQLITKEWFAQNVSGAVGAIAPYAAAALGAGLASTKFGSYLKVGAATSGLLQSRSMHLIAGATIYDGMRKPHEGETRLGNALGGATAFTVFETGNFLSSGTRGATWVAARMGTGALGGATHLTTSSLISRNELASTEAYANAMLSGATLNSLLPKLHEKAAEALLPSPTVASQKTTAIESGPARAQSGTNDLSTLETARPLKMRGPDQPGGIVPGFVRERVNESRARKQKEASSSEAQAGQAASDPAARLGEKHKAGGIIPEFMQERIKQTRAKQNNAGQGDQKANSDQKPEAGLKGQTDSSSDRVEIPFDGSKGTQRPQASLAEAQAISPEPVHKRRPAVEPSQVDWSAVNATAKVNLLKGLANEMPADRAKYFDALIDDTDSGVAAAAAEALPKLAANDRFDRWVKISQSDNWDVKDKTIELMAQLPKERLPEAFDEILSQPEVFLNDPNGLVRLGRIDQNTPNMQMVSLLQRPELTGQRTLKETLWNKAYENAHTRSAALANMDALPAESHSKVWNKAWDDLNAKGNRAGRSDDAAMLLAQAKNLPEAELQTAWSKIVQYNGDMTPAQLNPLLKSLPEANDVRLNAWRELLNTVNKDSKWDRGLMMALESLPESQRAAAWTEAFEALPNLDVNPLAKAVEALPAESRLAAYSKLIESGKELHSWTWNVRSLPPEQLPQLIETIKKIPDEISRKDMLLSVNLDVIFDRTPTEQYQIAKPVFEKVMADPVLREGRTLRKWWRQLEDQTNEHGQSVPELRQKLAADLPANGLAQILMPENPALASQLALKHPEAVRELAASRKAFFGADNRKIPEFDNLVDTWLKTGSLSQTVDSALSLKFHSVDGMTVIPELMAQVAKASPSETSGVLSKLFETIRNPEQDEHVFAKAIEIAGGIAKSDRTSFDSTFGQSLTGYLSSNEIPYAQRLDLARKIAVQQRLGHEGARDLSIPDLRMPKVEIPEEAQKALREEAERELRNPEALQALLGEGELGERFPMVFGDSKKGGMVGRIQHEGHEFTVDKHTLEQLTNILKDPRFKSLSEKEQTDLLWASVFHDSGKRPGISDPGHEWVSANLAWGVLESLGYPPERISRIATLISRHSELSFWPENPPSKALGNAENGGTPLARELSVFYRNPSAIDQLTILNTADIKALDGASSKFTPEVAAELQHAKDTVSAIHQQMAKPIPLLFTQLPSRFGLHTMPDKFQVLAHATPDEVAFLKHRPSIQSYRSNLSTSLFTREHQIPYQDTNFVVLVTSTPERISTAGPHNLNTGKLVDWQGHVDLSFDKSHHKTEWTNGYEQWLNRNGRGPKSMEELFVETTKFDNLNDLVRNGSQHLVDAQHKLAETITTNKDGGALTAHTEVKVNNPHIVGFGIMSKGRSLSFQNMDAATFESMLAASKKHAWLLAPHEKSANALVVPERTWRAVQESGLPLMVLDR